VTPTKSAAIFGAMDGASSILGVLAGLLVAHASLHVLLIAAAGGALSAGASMGTSSYASDRRLGVAVVMGLATLFGTLLPAVPVLISSGLPGRLVAGLLILALGVWIAELRAAEDGRARAYRLSAGALVVTCGLSIGGALLLGITG
jgi:hypothetical protein